MVANTTSEDLSLGRDQKKSIHLQKQFLVIFRDAKDAQNGTDMIL